MMIKRNSTENNALSEAVRRHLGDPDWLLAVRAAKGGRIGLIIEADPAGMAASESRRMDAESRAREVKGVSEVNAALTGARQPAQEKPPAPKTQRVRKGAGLSQKALQNAEPQPTEGLPPLPGISRIIAVASAKGGVGKSTVAVNLAIALAKQGLRVGLLDTDIYGPSVPTMLGTADQQPETTSQKTILPIRAHGIGSLSIGYLSDPDAPMIWRGPVVMSAITQMLKEGAWGTPQNPLDVLVLDTPPGTGDAALTLAQRVPLDGAILVTTPQEVALADVRRGAAMFTKTAVPVLGIVENMSWFEDPTGTRHALFGEGGGQKMADKLGLPLLGQLPILTDIRRGGDVGVPAALGEAESAALFAALAERVVFGLQTLREKPAPRIRFED